MEERAGLSPEDDDATAERYVNYQAFAAHLSGEGVYLPGPEDVHGIMRDASDEGVAHITHEGESHAVRDAWVLGAAQWIIWGGQGLFKQVVLPVSDGQITMKEWKEWKANFYMVVASEKYGEECISAANRAVDIMDALEKGMSFQVC